MGKLWMPMNNFKKVSEDHKSATLQHPDGHQIVLAKNILSPAMQQQLAQLQMHPQAQKKARGGKVKRMDEGGQAGPVPAQYIEGQSDPGPMATTGFNPHNPDPLSVYLAQKFGGQAPSLGANLSGGGAGGDSGSAGGGPTNPSIPSGGGGGAPMMSPSTQGIPGVFGGRSAQQLINQGYQEQLRGAGAQASAYQGYANQANPILQQKHDMLQNDLNMFWNGWTRPDGSRHPGFSGAMDEIDKVKQDILTNQINPNRFIEQGALPKVMTAIGLLGTMANSRGGGPKILEFINQQMQRDVQSQIADKSGKVNVLQANLQQLGNMQDAIKMTTFQHMAMQSALLEQAANNSNSKIAQGNYMQAAGMIHQQMAKQVYDWTMAGVLNQKVGTNGGGGSMGGMGGGAQAGGESPTDAVGNPLPRGMNVPTQYIPNGVQLPGGGGAMALGPQQQQAANNAVISNSELNSAIQGVKDATSTFHWPWDRAGVDKVQTAVNVLHTKIRELHDKGKLTPEEAQAMEQLVKSPGFYNAPWPFRGIAQSHVQDLGNVNNQQMNDVLKTNINNYEAPAKPKSSTKLVD